MTILIEELREKYPNPEKADPECFAPVGTYCVGGTLALELGYHATMETLSGHVVDAGAFPVDHFLAELLQEANPSLPYKMSVEFARAIIRKNDTGNFETAWGYLADALGYGEGEWTPADDVAVAEFLTGATS